MFCFISMVLVNPLNHYQWLIKELSAIHESWVTPQSSCQVCLDPHFQTDYEPPIFAGVHIQVQYNQYRTSHKPYHSTIYIYISFVLFSINHRDSLSLLGKKKQFNCFKPGWFPWAEQNLTFAGATGFCQTKVTYKTMYGHKTRYVGCSETYHVNKQTSLWP